MSLFLTAAAATQLCTGCTVEFVPTDTLGAREDPAGVGFFAEALDMGNRGYLVSSDALGGVVILYDSEGRYQRELTREGDGPGELRGQPRFAMGAGGIGLFEPNGPSVHLYSNDLSLTRTVQVGARVNSVFWDRVNDAWLVSAVRVDAGSEPGTVRLDPRILFLDQAGDSIRSMQVDRESSWHTVVDVIRGADNTIWTASMDGTVEIFDQDLALLGSLELELPGMDEWNRMGRGGVSAFVSDLHPAPDGLGVWVFAFGTAMSVSDVIEELERLDAAGEEPSFERLGDTFIYSLRLDPGGLTLVGTDRLDTIVRPLGDGDRAFDLVDTPDGDRRVRVGRLRFSDGSR